MVAVIGPCRRSSTGGQPAGPSAARQGRRAGRRPTFRARIDAVTVDAIVTDKQGRPVTDLKAEDFEITENKKPQAIQTFKLIKVDDRFGPDPAIHPDITRWTIRSARPRATTSVSW